MERSFRALIATALLTLVHGQVPVVQGTNPSSQIQAADEVDALVRQVLADRIAAKDIPDFGLLLGAKRIAVRSDGIGGLALGKDALPALEGYDLRLISTGEAEAEAERTQTLVHFIASTVSNWTGHRRSMDWRGFHDAYKTRGSQDVLLLSLIGVSASRRPLGFRPVGRHRPLLLTGRSESAGHPTTKGRLDGTRRGNHAAMPTTNVVGWNRLPSSLPVGDATAVASGIPLNNFP